MEIRQITTFYSNDAPDADKNDLYWKTVDVYQAVHDDNVDVGDVTVADVEGETPPVDHQWVHIHVASAPAGYSVDGAVDDAVYDSWSGAY